MVTVCATGHRPNKLGGYSWNSPKNKEIMNRIYQELKKIVESSDKVHLIGGGALGVDQMFIYVGMVLKRRYPNIITLEVAVPFKEQYTGWVSNNDLSRYFYQLENVDKVTYVDTVEGYTFNRVPVGKYHPYKMQIRNIYMVDKSDIVLSVWDGSKGGTGNCVGYADSKGKNRININPRDIEV